jgi:hemerythrin
MPFAQFSDDLRVGHEEIDRQHESLFEIVNRLHDAMRAGHSRQEQGNILTFLGTYTAEHFAAEEAFMRTSEYPELIPHQAEHAHLIEQLQEIQQKYEAGSMTLSIMVMHFLKDWLSHHIQEVDRKLAEHLRRG